MAELKTKITNQDPKKFLNAVTPEQKKIDSFVLLEMFQKVTGEKAVMWGASIVGFGRYTHCDVISVSEKEIRGRTKIVV
jgi:hypothetical protein